MTSPFVVRPIEAADFDRWLPLWDGYNAFYGRSGPTALPLDVTRETWRRFLDPAEPMHAIVAEDGGALLGLAHFLFHRNTILVGNTCYLQDLFTAKEARGRGVGEALIKEVGLRARQGGGERLYWHTHSSNATARRLYDRVADDSGFVVYRLPI